MTGITPDLINQYNISQAYNPAALTSDSQTSGIDLRDCGPTVTVLLHIGAVTGTTPTLTVTAQSSINDNTASAEAAADAYADITGASTSLTDSDANSVVSFTFHNRNERYVRLDLDVGGTSPSFTMGATVISKKTSY